MGSQVPWSSGEIIEPRIYTFPEAATCFQISKTLKEPGLMEWGKNKRWELSWTKGRADKSGKVRNQGVFWEVEQKE